MPVSGLVITLDGDDAALRARLADEPRIDLGERVDRKLPAVVDAPDPRTDRALRARIESDPDVRYVDVVFIHFDEPGDAAGGGNE